MKYQIRTAISFIILLMLFMGTSSAQTSLNGFLNIPFGIKMETAKKLLLQKSGTKCIHEGDGNNFYFTGFSLGSYQADTCILLESMLTKKFESCRLVFRLKAELLEEIHELFVAQYGQPAKMSREDIDIVYKWEFPVKGSEQKNSITLQTGSASDCFILWYSGMGTLSPGWLQQVSHKTKSNSESF